ncbi:MAG: NAD(P)/FAD-dependent oxidoreductase [Candidatus Acidiferrales bacterium]
MDRYEVLIIGAGPAGSACARHLTRAGLDVAMLERQRFPRDKVCGGWVTPAVLEEMEVDAADYARERVLQPITGFRAGLIGATGKDIEYDRTISYGIRRCEFDEYLARRCGARLMEGAALASLERAGDEWIVNDRLRARLLIGAGGHFCPVARRLGANARSEVAVAAQEIEFEMDAAQQAQCAVRADVPELFFCGDLRGYGWAFRKGNFLNVGLGRLSEQRLGSHVQSFVAYLRAAGRIGFDLLPRMKGHAYLLYSDRRREVLGDGVLLIGDAAGLAYSQSGEGIRPAIESGLLAAETALEANGDYSREQLEPYRARLGRVFGDAQKNWASAVGRVLPPRVIRALAGALVGSRWFARRVILDRWFLHLDEPALTARGARGAPPHLLQPTQVSGT